MLIPKFDKDYVEPLGMTEAQFISQNKHNLLNKLYSALNLCLNIPEEHEDYQGTWEDAFLFSGYENGKFKFLTAFVHESIRRHGFYIETTTHRPQYRMPSLGGNEIIILVNWKGQNCIPDKDINGNRVRVGITDPRLYLPDIVIKLLDLEFGYDKEIWKPF